MPKVLTAREAALLVMLRWAGRDRGETEGNNAGWFVEMLQRADSLPGEVYAWCQSTVNAAWRLATGGRIVRTGRGIYDIEGGELLAHGTASVGAFLSWAQSHGFVVAGKPARADQVCFHRSPGDWPYHVGAVVSARVIGSLVYLKTVEGNTTPAADESDPGTGDGVHVKRRVVRRSLVSFVRVPGPAKSPLRARAVVTKKPRASRSAKAA